MTPLRVISLGWGVQSWAMAAMVALGEMPPVDYAIHADTGHEVQSTYDLAREWSPWLREHGVDVVTVKAADTSVFHERWGGVMIPAFTRSATSDGQIRRQCTRHWKIKPIRDFIRAELETRGLAKRAGVVESLQGISLDEWMRMRDSDVAYIRNVYPLCDAKLTRADCIAWLDDHGLPVPSKSACTFCPYRSRAQWQEQKRDGGADWLHTLEADRALVEVYASKKKPIELYLHPNRKRIADAVSIAEDFDASQPSLLDQCDGGACWV